MSFQDAINLSPKQAQFLLMSHGDVKALAAQTRKNQLEGEGLDVREEVRTYQDDQREQFTGSRVRPKELDDPAEREAIKKAIRERRKNGKRKKPRKRVR